MDDMHFTDMHSVNVEKVIEYFMVCHIQEGKDIVSAQIDFSPFKAVFEKYATHHLVFNSKYRGQVSKGFVGYPSYSEENNRTCEGFDLVYIGGSHGLFKLAESLSFAICRMNNDAVLVLPHLDVPSTHFCMQYLKELNGVKIHLVMENTAFFGFSKEGSLDEMGSINSGFNIRNYPAFDCNAYTILPQIPFTISYEGYVDQLSPEIERGFMVISGRVYSEGVHSRIRLSLPQGLSQPLEIVIRMRGLGSRSRNNSSLKVYFDGQYICELYLSGQNTVILKEQTKISEDGILIVDMYHQGLEPAYILKEQTANFLLPSLPNIELLDISILPLSDSRYHRSISRHTGQITTFSYASKMFKFLVDDRHDSIQAHHYAGEFYEIEELELIGRYFSAGFRVLDVGANIGNHAVYFERILRAAKVVVIELQPRVIELLRINVALNELANTDLSKLGVGLGSQHQKASMHIPQAFNVAGAQFVANKDGEFTIEKGDDLFAGEVFDFIKIDVEGMECEVIDGLMATIIRTRPILFVEVWSANQEKFEEQMERMGYVVAEQFRRYDIAVNYLMIYHDIA